MNETHKHQEVRLTGDAFDAAAETLADLVRAMDREYRVLPKGGALRDLYSVTLPARGKDEQFYLTDLEHAMILGGQAALKRQMAGADELLEGLDELCASEDRRVLNQCFNGKAS